MELEAQVKQPPETEKKISKVKSRAWRELGLPLAVHSGLTILFTWPLLWQIGNRGISARSADLYQNLWNLWWFKTALFEQGQNPFSTDLLFYPDKPSLYLHAFNPLGGLLSTPLQALFGLGVAYNLLILAFFVAGGCAAYALARYLKLSVSGALLASVVFSYSPIISSQLDMGQLEQIMFVWLPLYLLFFLKALEAENCRNFWLNSGMAALIILCSALTTWYYTLDLLIFGGLAGLVCAWRTFRQKEKKWLGRWLALFGLSATVIAPLAFLTARAAATTPTLASRASSVLYNSAAPVLFFWPGDSLLWFSGGIEGQEYSQFLGYVALILVIIGVVAFWKKGATLWLGLFGFLLLLSLGPVVKTGLDSYTGIELPGALLQKLPIVGNFFRVPVRLLNFAMLPFGLLAGMGLGRLSQIRFPRLKFNFGWLLTIFLIGLIFLEYAPGERQTKSLTLDNALWKQINSGVVLNLPATRVEGEAMYAQTIHRRPMISGYLARRPDYDFTKNAPVLRELLQTDFTRFTPEPYFDKTLLPLLNVYDVRYIVVYRDKLEAAQSKLLDKTLEKVVNQKTLVGKDGAAEIYRVPEYQWQAQPESGWIIYEKNWYGEESNAEIPFYRWTANDATLMLVNPNPRPLRFRLDWTLFSYEQTRRISLELNGYMIGQKEATSAPEKQAFELELPPGYSLLKLTADKPAQRPANDKNRLLGFAVGTVKLTPL